MAPILIPRNPDRETRTFEKSHCHFFPGESSLLRKMNHSIPYIPIYILRFSEFIYYYFICFLDVAERHTQTQGRDKQTLAGQYQRDRTRPRPAVLEAHTHVHVLNFKKKKKKKKLPVPPRVWCAHRSVRSSPLVYAETPPHHTEFTSLFYPPYHTREISLSGRHTTCRRIACQTPAMSYEAASCAIRTTAGCCA